MVDNVMFKTADIWGTGTGRLATGRLATGRLATAAVVFGAAALAAFGLNLAPAGAAATGQTALGAGARGGPVVPVVACPTTYGGAAPKGLPVLPRTMSTSLGLAIASALAYYSNAQRSLAPVLGPRGWSCQVQVGADGTTSIDVYPHGLGAKPAGTGSPDVRAQSGSTCQGCVYGLVCALVPYAGAQLGFSMLPCPPRRHDEVVTWLSGSAHDAKPPVHDVVAFEQPGPDPTNGALLYDYRSSQGGFASEATCTLPASEHDLCSAVLNDFVRSHWLMPQ
jgi:hypothetical protein